MSELWELDIQERSSLTEPLSKTFNTLFIYCTFVKQMFNKKPQTVFICTVQRNTIALFHFYHVYTQFLTKPEPL